MLKVDKLACRRGRGLIFRGVSFTLNTGDLLCLKGRNGCGKSSLLRILCGLLPCFEGDLYWQGAQLEDFREIRSKLHYLGHLDGLKQEFTLAEMLNYWCVLDNVVPMVASPFLAQFGLSLPLHTPIRYLSRGQKRRLALSRLLIRHAPLWLLDEPATALDLKGQHFLANLIQAHRRLGGIVIAATHHDMGDVNAHDLVLDGFAA